MERIKVTIETERYMTSYKRVDLIAYREKDDTSYDNIEEAMKLAEALKENPSLYFVERKGKLLSIKIERIIEEYEYEF